MMSNRFDCLPAGPVPIAESGVTEGELHSQVQGYLQHGGLHVPKGCQWRHRVAILVPYRARQRQVVPFMYHMHRLLHKQNVLYQMFFVEQVPVEMWVRNDVHI